MEWTTLRAGKWEWGIEITGNKARELAEAKCDTINIIPEIPLKVEKGVKRLKNASLGRMGMVK